MVHLVDTIAAVSVAGPVETAAVLSVDFVVALVVGLNRCSHLRRRQGYTWVVEERRKPLDSEHTGPPVDPTRRNHRGGPY